MVLNSTINVDLGSGTIIFNAISGSDTIELITYDNSVQEVTFDARPDIIIQFDEFLNFIRQINILQTAILFNFTSVNSFSTVPFIQIIVNEFHDVDLGMWNLTVNAFTGPIVIEYQGTRSSTKLEMLERSSSKTLTFPEWQKVLLALNNYRSSIQAF